MKINKKPRVVHVHFNRFGQKRGEKCWTVHLSDRCIQTKKVIIKTPLESVFKGDSAPQPRAYFRGKAIVDVRRNSVVLT